MCWQRKQSACGLSQPPPLRIPRWGLALERPGEPLHGSQRLGLFTSTSLGRWRWAVPEGSDLGQRNRSKDAENRRLFVDSAPNSGNSCMDEKIIQNNSSPPTEVHTLLSAELGSKAVLCCSPVLPTRVVLTTWKITLGGQPLCTRAYRKETNQTSDTNCTDERITWASRPDLSPHLQINAVAVAHDGNYTCEIATSSGNFQHGYQLQVLVRPEANIFLSSNKTLVCEAVAGKPAAQISWIPNEPCVTKEQKNSNGTVTVRSTYSYSDSNVSTVTCLVSHLTGNRNLSEVLPSGTLESNDSCIKYIIPSIIIILIIVGSVWFLKIKGFSLFYIYRRCKLKKSAATPVGEEDEMQPYACYTEKNNPLYDTVNKVKMFQVSERLDVLNQLKTLTFHDHSEMGEQPDVATSRI
ncbi:cell surface glycoprotein CD200 receptor 1-like [Erethizon dorsatum]